MQHSGCGRSYPSAKGRASCGGRSGRASPGCSAIRREADEVISVAEPELFLAVSQWYQDFSQISDEDVRSLLDRSAASIPLAA